MDFATILALIMSIIQMIIDFISGMDDGTQRAAALIRAANNNGSYLCQPAEWKENASSTNSYLSGKVVKNCDLYPLLTSGEVELGGISGMITQGITHQSKQVYYTGLSTGSDGAEVFDLSGSLDLNAEGEALTVEHDTTVSTLGNNYVKSEFSSQDFGNSKTSQYLKALNSQVSVNNGNRGAIKVQLSANAKVKRPSFVSSSKFRSAFKNAIEERMDKKADSVLKRMSRNLE